MFSAFVGDGRRPVNGSLVVVVDVGTVVGIKHAHVGSAMFDVEKFFYAFVGGDNFCFEGALRGLILANGLPCYGTARAADEKARERAKLEEVDGSAVRNGVINLTTPTCVGKCREFMAFGR